MHVGSFIEIVWESFVLAADTHAEKLLDRGFRSFFPQLYGRIMHNGDLYLGLFLFRRHCSDILMIICI